MNKKNELIKQRDALSKEIAEIEEQERQHRIEDSEAFIKSLQKNKDFVLSLVKHDRTSCSDENVINGFGSRMKDGGCRCDKCALIEILNGYKPDGNCEIRFDVSISWI